MVMLDELVSKGVDLNTRRRFRTDLINILPFPNKKQLAELVKTSGLEDQLVCLECKESDAMKNAQHM
jgi:predicted exporter